MIGISQAFITMEIHKNT